MKTGYANMSQHKYNLFYISAISNKIGNTIKAYKAVSLFNIFSKCLPTCCTFCMLLCTYTFKARESGKRKGKR